MSEDIVKILLDNRSFTESRVAEKAYLESQLRKLAGIIHRQEEDIADLRSINQDLKYQLTQKHEQLNLKNEIDNIDDGRC
jgi:hypothetical protein